MTVLLLMAAGCTTVGSSNIRAREKIDFGVPAKLRVCVLKADDVKVKRANDLIAALNREFAPYGLTIEVAWTRSWTRPGFDVDAILDDVASRDLEAPCDRLLGLVDRNFGDFLWGLAMPEVLGAVEGYTHSHGYVVANWASLNQLIAPPEAAVIHEFYHLLGCPHAMSLTKCYGIIAALKHAVDPAADFLPGIAKDGEFLATRDAVNAAMRAGREEERAKREKRRAPPAAAK